VQAVAETWNGSSWTEVGDLNTARSAGAKPSNGTQTAAIFSSGNNGATVETWDGTSWTEVADVNTQRAGAFGMGTSTAQLICGGYPYVTNTENWNGSVWTEVNDLSTGRGQDVPNGAGTATSAMAAGGVNHPGSPAGSNITTNTEEWDFPPSTASTLTEGDVFLSGGTALKGFGKAAGIPAASWASGGSLNTARYGSGAAGTTQNASLAFAGYTTTYVANNESYNGTSWTELTDVNTARSNTAGAGSQTAALVFGGILPAVTAVTEKWDGSSWTEVSDLNTARRYLGSAGTQTAALAFGGYVPSPGKLAVNESWDGTSWTEVGDLNTSRYGPGGAGVQTSAVAFGGNDGGYAGETEKWDGSSWTESGDLNTARTELGALGQQTLALAFGGNGGSVTAATEIYNGTSWTELNDLSTARQRIALGPAGSSAAGLAAGGYAGSDPGVANTEEWTASATLSTVTVS
jgi:hypothetical protein